MSTSGFIDLTKKLGFISVTINESSLYIRASDIVSVWIDPVQDMAGCVIQIRGSDEYFYPKEGVEKVFKLMRDAGL